MPEEDKKAVEKQARRLSGFSGEDLLDLLQVTILGLEVALPGSREARLARVLINGILQIVSRRLRGEAITDEELVLEGWDETAERLAAAEGRST